MTKDEIIHQIKQLQDEAEFSVNFWQKYDSHVNSQYYAGKADAYATMIPILSKLEDCNNVTK